MKKLSRKVIKHIPSKKDKNVIKLVHKIQKWKKIRRSTIIKLKRVLKNKEFKRVMR